MPFTLIDGITLHYKLEGLKTGVPLVFINSLGTDLHLWDKLLPHFDDQFVILRYDKRGHGLSDSPAGTYSIHDFSDDLASLLNQLQLNPVILIGISVGGLIALDYTIRSPQQVQALILCDTGAKIGTTEQWNERIEAVRKHGMETVADRVLALWFVEAFSVQNPADYRGYRNMLTRTPAAGYAATCEALRDGDLRASVSAVEAKTLVLCGSEDKATSPQLGRELVASLSDAQFELIENAAHLPCVEQPDIMAEKIWHFLRENGYAG
jgi:3-oxoadipate enol-lactonase